MFEMLPVFIVAAGLFAAAFFAGAETALTAASRARMQALETSGDKRAGLVNRLIAKRGRLISALLLGGQLATIAASAYTTDVLVGAVGERGVVYATVLMTALVVVFGEVMPKTIALAYPDRMSLGIARLVAFFVVLFSPVVIAVEYFTRGLLRICGVSLVEEDSTVTGAEELKGAVDILHREGEVARSERDMVGGLLELDEVPVGDAMLHRTKMIALDADLPPEELVREALASPYSRLPLWRDNPDNIIGMLHVKDLFRAYSAAGGDASKINAAEVARDPWFIPEATTLREQLQAFLRRKLHSALVVDEYGVVQGLITLEDIIEEIVGDIKDEHDISALGLRQQSDGSLIVDGSLTIRDLNRAMDWDLPDAEAATIAGLVIHEARAIPETRQTFVFHGLRFEVLRKQRNRIAALRITPMTAREKANEAKKREG